MVYLISDLHGKFDFKGLKDYLANADEEDLLIILGDLGLQFEETEENRCFTEQFLRINKKIAIVDGNHENFEFLNSFPEEDWNGGRIHRLTENIVHLKRGNIYQIQGRKFFVFGGCKSSPKWKEMGLWHPGDEATEEECQLAIENLEQHGYQVDYVLTHKYEETPGRGTVCARLQELTGMLEEKVSYKAWYSGHWHQNKQYDEKHFLVYDSLTPCEHEIGIYIFRTEGSMTSEDRVLKAAEHYCGITDKAVLKVEKDSLGKPYFPKCPKLHLSISHSGDYWVCAFDSEEFGVDIQKHVLRREESRPESERRLIKMAHRFFHPAEAEFTEADGNSRFFRIWAAKESYVKYTGQGIDGAFSKFCVLPEDKQQWTVIGETCECSQAAVWHAGEAWFWETVYAGDYTLCVCTKRPGVCKVIAL